MSWTCNKEVTCPPYPDPRDCSAGVVNPDSCPDLPGSGESCDSSSPEICSYYSVSCCGSCESGLDCHCEADQSGGNNVWRCYDGDPCFDGGYIGGGYCTESSRFRSLIGGSCIEARTAIFTAYPGWKVDVICQTESALVPLIPTYGFSERYIVLLDDETGAVTAIHFGEVPIRSCPTDPQSDVICDFDGSCTYPARTFTRRNEICTAKNYCECYAEDSPFASIKQTFCHSGPASCVPISPPIASTP